MEKTISGPTAEIHEHAYSDESSREQAVLADNVREHRAAAWEVIRDHKRIVAWAFFFALSAVGWGFDAQVNGAAISVPSFRRDFGYYYKGEPVLPAQWQSAFNAASSIGQFFGGFLCSWISDRIGRKGGLAMGIIFSLGGILGEIFSVARPAFLISKLVLGLGLGSYLTMGPLYCSELSPTVLRGITTAGINMSIGIGQLLSNAAIKGFGGRDDRWAYRAPFACQLVFVVVLAAGLPFAPESPWYLVRKGRLDQARRVLGSLYGNPAEVSDKLAAMEQTVQEDMARDKSRWVDCFRGTNLVRTIISCGVFACQHFVGIIFVLGFSTYFFELAGLATSNAFSLGVGVTACGIFGNIFSWFVVNSYGRRKLFLQGMICVTTLLFLIGILDVIPTGAARWVQASLTVFYAFVYFLTIGAMAFVLLGEASSPTLRAKSTGLATATQAVFGITFNVVIPYMVNPDQADLKGKVGFVFGGLGTIATIWAFFYVPELKGKTFNEIDHLFVMKVKPRKMGSYAPEEEVYERK